MITVHLPPSLQTRGLPATLLVDEPVASLADLIDLIDRRAPGFRAGTEEAVFNFAVNDELLLVRAGVRELRDGDRVDIVPAISGGA
jgi:molybdopterin converting factor small subunit